MGDGIPAMLESDMKCCGKTPKKVGEAYFCRICKTHWASEILFERNWAGNSPAPKCDRCGNTFDDAGCCPSCDYCSWCGELLGLCECDEGLERDTLLLKPIFD